MKFHKPADQNDIEVVGKIIFSPVVTEAMVNGQCVVEYAPESDVTKEIAEMWKRIFLAT